MLKSCDTFPLRYDIKWGGGVDRALFHYLKPFNIPIEYEICPVPSMNNGGVDWALFHNLKPFHMYTLSIGYDICPVPSMNSGRLSGHYFIILSPFICIPSL